MHLNRLLMTVIARRKHLVAVFPTEFSEKWKFFFSEFDFVGLCSQNLTDFDEIKTFLYKFNHFLTDFLGYKGQNVVLYGQISKKEKGTKNEIWSKKS